MLIYNGISQSNTTLASTCIYEILEKKNKYALCGINLTQSGVFQGRVFSPTLFNVYIDRLLCKLRK